MVSLHQLSSSATSASSFLSTFLHLRFILLLELLTLFFVAGLPVLSLALHAAIVHHPACTAYFVFQCEALWSATSIANNDIANITDNLVFLLLFFLLMLVPRLRCVVSPRVKMGHRVSFDLLVWTFLWSKFVNEQVLLLFTKNFHP